MKYLCISPTYWPAFEFGGPIQSLHLLNRGLVNNSTEVTVYTTSKGQENILRHCVNHDGVNVEYFNYLNKLDFIGTTGWNFSTSLTSELVKNLKRYEIAYILSIWNYTTFISSFLCSRYKIPYVISPRGQLYSEVLKSKSWKKTPYYKLFVKNILNNAAAVHYTSEHEYENVHIRLGIKSKYIISPNGIFLNKKQQDRKGLFIKKNPHLKNKHLILYLGRLSWKKGIDILINAMPKLIREDDSIHLVIAGNDEGNYKNHLKHIIRNLKLNFVDLTEEKELSKVDNNNCITFTGYLNDKEKEEAMKDSRVFALSSHSENFGMSVVEAMNFDLPVIVSANVGISNIIKKDNAGLVVNNSSVSISNAVLKLLKNNKLSSELRNNAKLLLKENYDIDMISARFKEEVSKFI